MSAVPPFIVAIPARYGSTRLPAKPLREIAGVPMVVRVAQRALQAGAADVVVATDDVRIADALAGQGVKVCMTRAEWADALRENRGNVERAQVQRPLNGQ